MSVAPPTHAAGPSRTGLESSINSVTPCTSTTTVILNRWRLLGAVQRPAEAPPGVDPLHSGLQQRMQRHGTRWPHFH
eukprot:54637-Eustigmatos_ZCMA.PRE.1